MAGFLKERLFRTKEGLFGRVKRLLTGSPSPGEVHGELEEILLTSDISPATARKILESLDPKISNKETMIQAIRVQLLSIFASQSGPFSSWPAVIMVVGVNGAGKTTTIGKMAKSFVHSGKKGVLAACDTFRAAAIEQLEILADRVGVRIVKQRPGADPAAVAFDALKSLKASGEDFLILDTAGRLHTKQNLMEELKKIKRVLSKEDPSSPNEILLVLDASFGQNVLSQVKEFHESLGVTGLVMTKMDGTAKGGTLVSLADLYKIPIRYIGVGETENDLLPFDPKEFVDAIFS